MTTRSSQAERLRQALIEARISRIALARLMEDDDASPQRVTNTRRQIVRWLKGRGGISDPNAVRIAVAFNKREPDRYPLNYFLKEPEPTPSWADELAALHKQRQRDRAAAQKEIRKLREELERARQELSAEIERMREAS